MPRVPTYDGLQVAQNRLPQAQLQPLNYRAPVGNAAAQQAQQTGQTLVNAGGQMGKLATAMQDQANQLRVDEALNRLKEETLRLTYDQEVGYDNLKGINALERPDGKPLSDEYSENLMGYISDVERGLGNPIQKAAFARAAQGVLTNFRGQLMRHESNEYQTYALSVSEGVQATALREIALSWNDPETIDKAIKRIKAHTYQQGQLLGKSAEWQHAQARAMASKAHKQALIAALEHNDTLYADAYLNRYAEQMEAEDILAVRSHITEALDLQVGDNIGAEVFASHAPELAPNDFTRLTNVVAWLESRGQDFDADGNPLTSSAGAKYAMQVMPATAKNPGFGIKPAAEDSPEEYNRVGRELLPALVKKYKGDLSKTLAAYNWGTGNVDKAIKKHEEDWLSHAPGETKDYVTGGLAKFGSGSSVGHKPTLAEMKAELRAQPELVNNPKRLKYAEARLESDYKTLKEHNEQIESEALNEAYNELYANGGNFNELPPEVRMAIPGTKLNSLMSFAEKISKNGGFKHDPEAWAQVLSLPKEVLAGMKPIDFFRQFRPVLDDTHLEKGYALLADAQGEASDKHLEIITTAARVKDAAIQAGILPSKGSPSKDEISNFSILQQTIDEKVRRFEQNDLQGKRKANSQELQSIIDAELMNTVSLPRWYWSDKTDQLVALLDESDMQEAYVTVGDEKIPLVSIPTEQRALITSKLRTRGFPVTEQAIADLWVKAGKPK